MATSVLTEGDLISRVQMMRKGETTVYYKGHLATDAFFSLDVSRLRDAAQRLSTMRMLRPSGELYQGMGLITLSQRRVGELFHYIATRVTK